MRNIIKQVLAEHKQEELQDQAIIKILTSFFKKFDYVQEVSFLIKEDIIFMCVRKDNTVKDSYAELYRIKQIIFRYLNRDSALTITNSPHTFIQQTITKKGQVISLT